MRILLVTQYFWPESFRINDLALTLKELGHEVTVLTGKPNYPKGQFYKGYGFWNRLKEDYKGINILRIPIIPRGNANGVRLAVNYLSFSIFGALYTLFLRARFDISLSFCPSPIISALPAIVHKRIKGYKTFTWVQDLWPESVSAAGKTNNSFLLHFIKLFVQYIYKKSDVILIQSEAFRSSICNHKIEERKITYIPNWAEDLFSNPLLADPSKYKSLIPPGFIIMFAGNLGEAQDFESIIKAAELTTDHKEIKWVIIGDGRKKAWLVNEIERLGLSETVLLLGSFPVEEMPSFFVHADIMLVSLKNEPIFSLTIPSKIQSYMASGKPILTMLDGIGSEIINDAKCGLTSPAGDYKKLVDNIYSVYSGESNTLLDYGVNSYKYYKHKFSKEMIVGQIVSLMKLYSP